LGSSCFWSDSFCGHSISQLTVIASSNDQQSWSKFSLLSASNYRNKQPTTSLYVLVCCIRQTSYVLK
jgi:hypothetical protein